MTEREKFGFPSIPPVLVGLPAWYSLLIIDDNGHARAIAKNAETALENDPAFAGTIRLDEFRGQTMVAAPLPWDPNWWEPGRGKTSTTLALCCGCKIMEFWSVVLSFMKLLTQSQKLMPITR